MHSAASFRHRLCANVVARGGVIACPTEAVWGLSCDPFSDSAVQRLLDLKERPAHKGLILVAADESQLAFLLGDLPGSLQRKVSVSWPGPNTWLVPHQGRVPPLVHGRFESVAVRVRGWLLYTSDAADELRRGCSCVWAGGDGKITGNRRSYQHCVWSSR